MRLQAPAVIGQTALFAMQHPASAAGNLYALLWSPPFAGAVPVSLPGSTVNGLARVDLANFTVATAGILDSSGLTPSFPVPVPNAPSLVGFAWDLQSVDLGTASVWTFADDDLAMVVSAPLLASLNMVSIAAGTFQMGSPVPLNVLPYYNQAEAQPVHAVTITQPFWMGRYEVTQAQYQAVMGSNPSLFQGASWPNAANRPVERVWWFNAVVYCDALTVQEAAAGRLPVGYEYRLPTEAEWEYCCRAGTTTEFHYGPTLACGQANFGYSYHTSSSCSSPGGVQTAVVGGYAPNAWGLYDMHGNVWEWCLDSWDVSANYPAGPVSNPYVTSGANRVLRGGGWDGGSTGCRAARRSYASPTYTGFSSGFRVVCAPVLP
jgi:formylglycine-generating enzyme required for sulfatase activity